jgi:hypothetical protein
MNLAPTGNWPCAWKNCSNRWTGAVDETPADWSWLDLFAAKRLIVAGDIDAAKALWDPLNLTAFYAACLCRDHRDAVSVGHRRAQLSPKLFFSGEILKQNLREALID